MSFFKKDLKNKNIERQIYSEDVLFLVFIKKEIGHHLQAIDLSLSEESRQGIQRIEEACKNKT